MEVGASLDHLSLGKRLNFLLTNRIPRRALTLFMGRFSKIESPPVRWLSIKVWQLFASDLRLHEAKKSHFNSLHDCFTRELKRGARTVDAGSDVLCSPCDAIVGEFGRVDRSKAIQAKGFPYTLNDLFADKAVARKYASSLFVTLRLKSSMYHRFHSPCEAKTQRIRYISGDTWNVNPIALSVIDNLFCKNERAVIELELEDGCVALVAVAAILVASMRFDGLRNPLNLRHRGPNIIPFPRHFSKGEEIGYFEHGSTILMFANGSFSFATNVRSGQVIRMGQALLRRAEPHTATQDDK